MVVSVFSALFIHSRNQDKGIEIEEIAQSYETFTKSVVERVSQSSASANLEPSRRRFLLTR